MDDHSRECLAIRVKRKQNSTEVIDSLTDLFILRGVPGYIRSDNDPEFIAEAVKGWVKAVGAKTAYIEPESPWENEYCESFNGRMRDELLNGEVFYSLHEAQIIIERWRNITTPNNHIVHWGTVRLRQRPSSRWTIGQSCTNFQFGPLKRDCSVNQTLPLFYNKKVFWVLWIETLFPLSKT